MALAGGFGALPPDPALIDGQEAPSPIDPAGAVNSVDDSGIGEDIPSRLEPPADGPMPAGVQAAVATTDLEIVHQNRLKLATLSVWIDGRSALSVKLEAKSPLQRIKGREHRWLIPVPAGRHAVEVRVSGVSKELEASHEVWWVFSEEDPQRLTVKLWPESRQLGLQWESR